MTFFIHYIHTSFSGHGDIPVLGMRRLNGNAPGRASSAVVISVSAIGRDCAVAEGRSGLDPHAATSAAA